MSYYRKRRKKKRALKFFFWLIVFLGFGILWNQCQQQDDPDAGDTSVSESPDSNQVAEVTADESEVTHEKSADVVVSELEEEDQTSTVSEEPEQTTASEEESPIQCTIESRQPACALGALNSLAVQEESRCSDYDRDDYHYSQRVEDDIIRALKDEMNVSGYAIREVINILKTPEEEDYISVSFLSELRERLWEYEAFSEEMDQVIENLSEKGLTATVREDLLNLLQRANSKVDISNINSVYSPYNDTWYCNKYVTDIEHMIAVSEAHDSGMCMETVERRSEFASDPLNLTLASPGVNRNQKRAKDAAEWMPDENQCWFAGRVIAVRSKYGLSIDRVERQALRRVLDECKSLSLDPPLFSGVVGACSVRDNAP